MTNVESLRFELDRSPVFAALILGLHGTAALSVLAVLPAIGGAFLAVALVALGVASARSRALMAAGQSVRAIQLESANGATLELADGQRISGELAHRRYVNRFMVSLSVLRPGRRTILVCRDMLEPDAFRRLRIWALWGKVPGVAGKQLPS